MFKTRRPEPKKHWSSIITNIEADESREEPCGLIRLQDGLIVDEATVN